MSWNSLQLSVLKPKPKVIATANHNKALCHHRPMRTESNSGWLRKERENAGGQVTSGVHLASDWFRHSSRPDQTQTDVKQNQCHPGIFTSLRWKLLYILRFCFKTTNWNCSHTYAKNVLRLKTDNNTHVGRDLFRQPNHKSDTYRNIQRWINKVHTIFCRFSLSLFAFKRLLYCN